ncbi:EF-hand domain-containing protein [Psychroserpens ponticola]|uniref:EF-hand domain-containing protein n=1 Tax=Psychroserpens ponticola TaxID=2932268 RepID=A0ABY7RU60_9FLAO|nr:EF-hand domain-containing protein [Psychroserpens ponticola]WCO00652.1 EF-hand domain-containing protein [Psychroserpens ponticola]
MKNCKLRMSVLALGMTVLVSNSSFGQPGNGQDRKNPPTFKQLLKDLDANEDGKLSKDEVKGPLKEVFTKVDTDEDGFITEKEFENAPKPKKRERKEKR